MKLARFSILLCSILAGTVYAAPETGGAGARAIPDLFSSKTHATQAESKPFSNAPASVPVQKTVTPPITKSAEVESGQKIKKSKKSATHTKTSAKPSASIKSLAVINFVKAWTEAWSAKDADKYLAFYATDFHTPKGISRTDWEAQRRERIAKPAHIRVIARKITVSFADKAHATAQFQQNYHSTILKSTDDKTLLMVKSGDTWLIQEERNN